MSDHGQDEDDPPRRILDGRALHNAMYRWDGAAHIRTVEALVRWKNMHHKMRMDRISLDIISRSR